MAPFLDSEILTGIDPKVGLIDADPVMALKAVHDLISTYFAKGAIPGLDSLVNTPASSRTPEPPTSVPTSTAAPRDAIPSRPEIEAPQPIPAAPHPATNNTMPHHSPPPSNPDHLNALLATITTNVPLLSGPDSLLARQKAATAAAELSSLLRPPPETIMSWFSSACVVSAVHLSAHWNLFDTIPSGPSGISISSLASKLNTTPSLLTRISWMLTSSSVLTSPSPGHLAHTPLSLHLRHAQPMAAMFRVLFTNIVETSSILPSFFDTYGRMEPEGPSHVPTSILFGNPSESYFDHVNASPSLTTNFMRAMSITHRSVPTTGMYPMSDVLSVAATSTGRTVWVDVGGGDGHTIKLFCEEYGLPAKQCVVQDLPSVVTAAKRQALDTNDAILQEVRFADIDFHRETPVEGAYRYYLRHILRDYSDSVVETILRNVAGSLTTDNSDARILVAEQVIEEPPRLYAAFKDYTMLAIGGKERTLDGFGDVADRAGLEISGVFRDRGTPHAVIEMRLKR